MDDTAETYKYVVRLTGGNNSSCSGVLISPYWILTASHCFNPSGIPVNGAITVRFGYDPVLSGPNNETFQHTAAVSGNVIRRFANPDPNLIWDNARDLAMFRLDTRVPALIASPLHISVTSNICPGTDFDGTAIGYGNGWIDNRCATIAPVRRYSTHAGWYRFDTLNNASYYHKNFAETTEFCDNYSGSANGDSGGPLLDNQGHLCGIFSVFGPELPSVNNDYAAVDNPGAIAWMLTSTTTDAAGKIHRLLAENGGFEGECDGPDMDGDSVPDKCDVCPRAYDPKQAVDPTTGRGVACDLCPGVDYDATQNRNFEAELGNGYPGLTSVPVFDADYPGRDTEIVLLPLRVRPDACDGTVTPTSWRDDSPAPLPESELTPIVQCGVPPTPGCNCPALASCAWEVDPTVIVTRPLGSDGGPGFPAQATFGLRFCECKNHDTTTLAGRVACQSTCPTNHLLSPDLYQQQGGPWVPVSIEAFKKKGNSGPWAAKSSGLEYVATVDGNPVRHKWDFLDLRAHNIGEEELGAGGQLESYSAEGILWVSVRQVQGDPNPFHTADYAHTYLSGDASASLVVGGSGGGAAPPFWLLSKYCPSCPGYASRIKAVVNDPNLFWATEDGVAREIGAPESLRALYADVATGALRYVEAAEPLERLAELTAPGQSMLRGVALDSTVSVAKMFSSTSLEALPDVQLRVPHVGTPEIRGNEGFVLSSLSRRVFVFGGTTSGAASGVPSDLGWSLDIDTNLWTSFPLGILERPASVLGATFRFQDERVYEVDTNGSIMRLRSWRAGEEFETRATFPASWHGYDRGWLAAGPRGDLVFAASRSTGSTTKTRLARFVVDGLRRLRFAGLVHVQDSVIAAPIAGSDAVSLVVPDPSGGRLLVVPFSDFHPASTGQAPEIANGGN